MPQGDYAFTGLTPGTYTVAEVPQPGWQEDQPSAAQGGVYTITVTAGQVVSGVDFGNQWLAGTLAFTSTAPTVAMVGQPYGYEAEANDTDGDTLTYDLPLAPAGMVVDPTTGAVVWTPTSAEIGAQTVILRAQDGNGGVVLQSFTVYVVPPNYPPVITSPPPPPTAVENVPYQYQLTAQDADTDPLTWQLSDQGQITPDISIGAFTGLLTWTPQQQDLGTNYITVTVSDGRGCPSGQQPC